MLLPDFMDATYALVMEERQRIAPLADFTSLHDEIISPAARAERVPAPREVKAQNESSMAALQAMLAPVPNAPTKRKPRRVK